MSRHQLNLKAPPTIGNSARVDEHAAEVHRAWESLSQTLWPYQRDQPETAKGDVPHRPEQGPPTMRVRGHGAVSDPQVTERGVTDIDTSSDGYMVVIDERQVERCDSAQWQGHQNPRMQELVKCARQYPNVVATGQYLGHLFPQTTLFQVRVLGVTKTLHLSPVPFEGLQPRHGPEGFGSILLVWAGRPRRPVVDVDLLEGRGLVIREKREHEERGVEGSERRDAPGRLVGEAALVYNEELREAGKSGDGTEEEPRDRRP